MAQTTPPNLPGKERDTGFVMYDWFKRMRQWAIDSYAQYLLKSSPDGGQTLEGSFSFETTSPFTAQVIFNGVPVYFKYTTDVDTLITASGGNFFYIFDNKNSKSIWSYDNSTGWLYTDALRIVGDFGNATPASRTSFTGNAANAACHIQAIPTGTNTTSSFRASSTNDIGNANIGSFGITSGTELRIQSTVLGSVSTYIPIVVYNGGVEVFRFETDGRVSGTKLHNTGTVTGTTNQYIASGTYTPTATNVTNATAGTCEVAKWTRVGNVVSVSGRMALTPTAAATTTVWGLSLPIASNFAATSDLNGLVNTSDVASTTRAGFINADITNDRANLTIRSSTNASENYYYMYQYEVL